MARVYQTPNSSEATVRVTIVSHADDADLCVYRVSKWGLAEGDALWYMTRNKQDAGVWAYFGSVGAKEVRVCFVDNEAEAGWRRPHPLKGRFG